MAAPQVDVAAVMLAVGKGDMLTLQAHIAATEGACINAQGAHGLTPLLLASRVGKINAVEMLLQHGADIHYNNPHPPNEHSPNAGTALHEACKKSSKEIVEILFQRNADLWQANTQGDTPFDCAQQAGFSWAVQKFKERAIHIANINAKCLIHYEDSEKRDGVWKDCTAVVTPYRAFHPTGEPVAMKRVYFFKGFPDKAKAHCTYEAGEAIKDSRVGDAELRMKDPSGCAVHIPSEHSLEAMRAALRDMPKLKYGFQPFAYALNPMGTALNIAHAGAAATSFQLLTEGRKTFRPSLARSETGTPPDHTSIFFKPLEGSHNVSSPAFDAFLTSLDGPVNEMQRIVFQTSRAVRMENVHTLHLAMDVDVTPKTPPADLLSTNTEPACVICLTEKPTRGYWHANKTMHGCVCSNCVKVAPVGAPCPVCRQAVEGIAAL